MFAISCNKLRRMLKEWLMKTNSLTSERDAPPVIRLDRREIRHGIGLLHMLSRVEADLLSWLRGRAGQPVTRSELLTGVWRLDPLRTVTRTVDMHISRLRKKLGDDSRRPALLVTVHRVGYMMRPMAAIS